MDQPPAVSGKQGIRSEELCGWASISYGVQACEEMDKGLAGRPSYPQGLYLGQCEGGASEWVGLGWQREWQAARASPFIWLMRAAWLALANDLPWAQTCLRWGSAGEP